MVDLGGSRINGDLVCSGGTFTNPQGNTIDANRAKISGSVFLRNYTDATTGKTVPFSSAGTVNLISAQIGGNLECEGGRFDRPKSIALNADSTDIGGNVFLRDGFTATGDVDFIEATIRSQIDCTGGSFGRFDLHSANVRQFIWKNVRGAAVLDLRNASVGMLVDDMGSWTKTSKPYLDGLVYESIGSRPIDVAARLGLIARQGDEAFSRQPYLQLARVLRQTGYDDDADRVLYEMERQSRTEARRRLPHAPARWLRFSTDETYGLTVGYGVYPERAIYGLGALSAVGWVIFRRAKLRGGMVPADQGAYDTLLKTGALPQNYPPFNPLMYAVENALPLVKFGQDDHWQIDSNPVPRAATPATGANEWHKCVHSLARAYRSLTSPTALRWMRWTLIALGWILATIFVTGLTQGIRSN